MQHPGILPERGMLLKALACKCPKCGQGDIYESGFSMTVRTACSACGLALATHDSADGPAVFLIFILGFSLVPMALVLEYFVHPALWVHAVVWGLAALGLTLGLLRPLKAYIIALQFKYRPHTLDKN